MAKKVDLGDSRFQVVYVLKNNYGTVLKRWPESLSFWDAVKLQTRLILMPAIYSVRIEKELWMTLEPLYPNFKKKSPRISRRKLSKIKKI